MKKTAFNPFDTDSENRYAAFEAMRAEGSIHDMPGGQRFFVRQSAVETGLKSVDSFVGSFGNTGDAGEDDIVMAAIPEPRHGKLRKMFNSALGYHHVSKIEPYVREYAAARLDESLDLAKRDGQVEIMESYARRIPSAVIARVLGIPNDRTDDFARWSDEILERMGGEDEETGPLRELHPEFCDYLRDQIKRRVESDSPPDDMFTRMLHGEVDGKRLGERAVLTQSIFLIVAGNETTRNLIGNLLYRLAADPALYEKVRRDRSLVPLAIEETLRIDSPVQLLARTCTEETEIDGVEIKVGDRVLHSIASANRDERVYTDPDEFRLDRPRPREHVAFGAGPHICPGAYLARMEAQVAVETLLDRVERIELAADYTFDPNPVFWAFGPQTLQVTLQPA